MQLAAFCSCLHHSCSSASSEPSLRPHCPPPSLLPPPPPHYSQPRLSRGCAGPAHTPRSATCRCRCRTAQLLGRPDAHGDGTWERRPHGAAEDDIDAGAAGVGDAAAGWGSFRGRGGAVHRHVICNITGLRCAGGFRCGRACGCGIAEGDLMDLLYVPKEAPDCKIALLAPAAGI